jgi:hypothetical protein
VKIEVNFSTEFCFGLQTMGRRRWQKIGNSSNRKLVTVLEAPWSPIRSERISVEEEKILAKAEEIRLRQSGFVYKSKQTKEVINSELLKGVYLLSPLI